MDWFNPLIGLCCWLPILYVSVFAHEFGHALVGRAVGFAVTSFGLGLGRPFALFSRGRTRIYFCRTKPVLGITFCVPPLVFPTRRTMVPYLAGGIIANALLCVAALALLRWLPWGANVWFTAAAENAVLAITNLVPFQVQVGKTTMRSDGRQILEILRNRVISTPAPQVIQTLKGLRDFWKLIGNHTMLRLYTVGAAAAYSELDDYERAELVLSELDSQGPRDLITVQAREALVRGAVSCGTGRLDDAADALQAADALFQAMTDDGGLLATAMQRSWLRLLTHDTSGAHDELSALASHRLVKQSSWIQSYVHAFCVRAHAAASNAVEAERSLVAYEATRGRHWSSVRDLQVYRSVCRLRAENDDWVRAELAYRRAFKAILELASLWANPEDRAHFLERQSSFLDEARHCYRVLNRADEADRLIARISSAKHIQQSLDDARRREARRLSLAGRWTVLIDVFSTVGLIGLLAFFDLQPGHPFFAASTMFALFTFFAVILFIPYLMIGWIVPRSRYAGSIVMIILAFFPWLAMLSSLMSSTF